MATILFPTDFSTPSRHALAYLLPIAQRLKAKIILLHVFHIPTQIGENPVYNWEEQVRLREALIRAELEDMAAEIHEEYPNQEVSFLPRFGFTVPGIIAVCEAYEADWIVMGTKGASGLKRLFFGTNTAQVIQQADCPVLAVPHEGLFRGIRKIVYATNYAPAELDSLEKLSKLAALFEAEIQVFHLYTENEAGDGALSETFQQQVRERFPQIKFHFRTIPYTDLQTGLNELMVYTEADLLAMSPQRRNLFQRLFHPSQTESMAYQTVKPLLAV